MRPKLSLSLAFLTAALVVPELARAQAGAAQAGTHKKAVTWGPAPAVFPAGARMAVLDGDPGKAGPFAVQLEMPNGYRIPPHFHPTDESVRVQRGMLLVGMGDAMNLKKANRLSPGDTGTIKADMHHYAAARGRTVVTIRSMGPFAMTYVNPADDPQRKPTP